MTPIGISNGTSGISCGIQKIRWSKLAKSKTIVGML